MVKINPESPVQLARHRLLLAREAVKALKMTDEKPAKERLGEILAMIRALAFDLADVLEWHYGELPAGPHELPEPK
jgi:hypothetical protein